MLRKWLEISDIKMECLGKSQKSDIEMECLGKGQKSDIEMESEITDIKMECLGKGQKSLTLKWNASEKVRNL